MELIRNSSMFSTRARGAPRLPPNGKATVGIAGVGGGADVVGTYFQKITGTRFQFVPYRGAAPIIQDLLAGHIDLTFCMAAATAAVFHLSPERSMLLVEGTGCDTRECAFVPVQQLLPQRQYFGPDDINVLSSALDEALRELKISDRTDPATRFLAKRIIQLAQQGERDPIRLREGALKGVVIPAPLRLS